MIYVMSDLHGRYDLFCAMLERIRFGEEDELYILGDLCDRGHQSAQLYWDVMGRDNVHCVMGNHESMLLEALPHAFGFLQHAGYAATLDLDVWNACGGGRTCASFLELGAEKVRMIYEYVKVLPPYRVVEVEGRRYLMVHAGLEHYDRTRLLADYAPEELMWYSLNYHDTYYPMLFDRVLVGHTPTFLLNHTTPATVFYGRGNVINLDCGAAFSLDGGRLACLCLNTMAVFYE